MRALILDDGSGHGALAAARSLGRDGWDVGLGTPDPGGVVAGSRWVRRTHRVPWPEHGLDRFAQVLGDVVRAEGYRLVFAGGDDWVAATAIVADEAGLPLPHRGAAARAALDKLALGPCAEVAGLRYPETVAATAEADARWSGPAVVKCREHWVPGLADPRVRLEACFAADAGARGRAVARVRDAGGTPLLQRPLEDGTLGAVAGLHDGRGWVMVVQQRSDRVWPLPLGTTARAATIAVDRELAERTGRFVAELGLDGVVQVELLYTADGVWVIDVNPRLYGTLALATAAGADLPAAWARWRQGEEVPPAEARPGVHFQWTEAVLRRALVGADGPRGGALLEAARVAATAVHPTWSSTDPGPAGRLAVRAVRRGIAALRRRVAARADR